MKKKILIIILIIIIVILSIFIIYSNFMKKLDIRYLTDEYLDATLLKVTTNLNGNNTWSNTTEGETGFIIVDTTFNNTVTPKDYNLRFIKYKITEGNVRILKSKMISNNKYNEIKEIIDNIEHYNQSIDSPSYMVNFRRQDSFIVKMSDFDINSI